MELQGKIIAVLPERSGVSARGEWKVQEFVLETIDSQYPRKMVFDVFGAERLQRFNIQIGQTVLVAFDIDAHEYNGRWFNSIRAFDVRQVDSSQVSSSGIDAPQPIPMSAPNTTVSVAASEPIDDNSDSPDNLPF